MEAFIASINAFMETYVASPYNVTESSDESMRTDQSNPYVTPTRVTASAITQRQQVLLGFHRLK